MTALANLGGQRLEHRHQSPVAAWLQQVGAHGGRIHTGRDRVGEIVLGDAGRETDHDVAGRGPRQIELTRQCLVEFVEERHRQHVQRWPGQVHRVVRHPLLGVVDHQRVGQLDPELSAAILGVLVELLDQLDTAIELEICLERGLLHRDVGVAQFIVDDPRDDGIPEQGRVQLDDDIELVFIDQVLGDRFDLLGRTTVERRQRERVGHSRVEAVIGKPGP